MSFGSTPKVESPKIIPPATPPSQDQAAERATTVDRTLFRRGRAATRLATDSGGAPQVNRTATARLLGGAS